MATDLKGMTIGFIGLGLMGRPMCRNLMRAGARLIVNNRSPGPVEEMVAEGAIAAAMPAAVTRQADIVILMLTDTAAVKSVLPGENGVLSNVGGDTLMIDMGTTAPGATRNFAKAVEGAGGAYIDAPVSGGMIGAEDGSLTIMAGGLDADIARAMPVFDVLGGRITHVGEVACGQIAKAANQVIVGLTIGAVAEALALAKRAGADPVRVKEALGGGFAGSRILEVHGQRMIDGDFTPGGKSTTQRKDLFQALELAGEVGLEMPATALNMALYDRLIAAGDGDLDHAALFRLFDKPT